MRPAILVSTDGETQPEGEDQTDDSEQRTLQYANRFPVGVAISPRVPAQQHTDDGRPPDDGEDQDAELPTAEREEQRITEARRASGRRSVARAALRRVSQLEWRRPRLRARRNRPPPKPAARNGRTRDAMRSFLRRGTRPFGMRLPPGAVPAARTRACRRRRRGRLRRSSASARGCHTARRPGR